jgi:hypothetical protein
MTCDPHAEQVRGFGKRHAGVVGDPSGRRHRVAPPDPIGFEEHHVHASGGKRVSRRTSCQSAANDDNVDNVDSVDSVNSPGGRRRTMAWI